MHCERLDKQDTPTPTPTQTHTHTHTHIRMTDRVPHLLPSVSSVPGHCLCPEGGWPQGGAWQSWPYLRRQTQTDQSLESTVSGWWDQPNEKFWFDYSFSFILVSSPTISVIMTSRYGGYWIWGQDDTVTTKPDVARKAKGQMIRQDVTMPTFQPCIVGAAKL